MGSDFPPHFRQLIDSWRTQCIFRLENSRLTTRAWNGYGAYENRAFKYLTPKLRLEEGDLSTEQVMARSFHMVCSPTRCIDLVTRVLDRRKRLSQGRLSATTRDEDIRLDASERPIFVWEPVPDLCTPKEFARLCEAARYVDVVSPNAEEFASFFRDSPDSHSRESRVQHLLGLDRGNGASRLSKTALVVREGAHGCTTYVGSTKGLHLRAYHQSKERIVDPTGGGNTFLGALAMGLTGVATPQEDVLNDLDPPAGSPGPGQRRLLLALVHATVAAAYAIEQTGMPSVSETDGDCWNGKSYQERFAEYLKREREHIIDQPSQDSVDP